MTRDVFIYIAIKEIARFLGGEFGLFSEKRSNSSELWFLSSELSFHSSELLFRPSVGNLRLLPGACRFPQKRYKSAGTTTPEALFLVDQCGGSVSSR